MSFDDATQRQIDAASPGRNTWLSANAGSGKTRVLTDRVARLLLSDVEPQNILCLTYTKAAASEMQNRLFKRLGEWAMLDDAALTRALADLGAEGTPDLSRARQLFARAIETPGGLKIQTIHAFCASILRRFPMEAGVSPDFQEMDDRSGQLLRDEVLDEMAEGTERPLVEDLFRHYTGADVNTFLSAISARRHEFATPVNRAEVFGWFGLDAALTMPDLVADLFSPDVKSLLPQVIPILRKHSTTMQKLASGLAALDLAAPGPTEFEALCDCLLTKAGTLPKSLVTKAAAAELGPLADPLIHLANRVFDAHQARRALLTAERTLALHAFARPFVTRVEARKAARGWLDFDDLIHYTARLLTSSELAQWVLYRLDGGIDHILVDESQDTSPDQWRVVQSIAREFMSGEGAHADRDWSVFVVGDPKQSIYSFQGADPVEFLRMRDWFAERLEQIARPLQELPLQHSFRSSPAVLDVVDRALASVAGLGETPPDHLAFHAAKPGLVDQWPFLEKEKEPEAKPWDDPVDMPAATDHNVILAEAVAEDIARMIACEKIPHGDGFRPVEAGDILVLVQRRSELFHHIIRACKSRGVAIAGADRLKIGGEMAVKDLTALLNVLATPEDDLSLAAVLRSPLFGWSEDALYRLGVGRGGYLWQALREAGPSPTLATLMDLRDNADFLRPYDLIDRVLTRHDGRRLLTGRLGAEAEDGIDAMLSQALAYERLEVPSLTGFLTWLAAEEVEIKRQMDTNPTEVRVMTVHGSKGLEAPVVILPDAARRDLRGRGELLSHDGKIVWKPRAPEMPDLLQPAIEAGKDREREERMRLLYVAMTRAESWLIVAGAGETGKEPEDSWYGIVEAGLGALETASLDTPLGLGRRYQRGDWPEATPQEVERAAEGPDVLPPWAEMHAPRPVEPPKPLTPSDLGGDKILSGAIMAGAEMGLDAEAAKRRGRQVHRLLEFLPEYPEAHWDEHAAALLAFGEDSATGAELADLLAEARDVLTCEALAPLFSADALAEVEITAPVDIAGRDRIHGIIDRLILSPGRVLAIDFKSNLAIPERPEDIPEGILRQLGAYEAALTAIYPDREIASAVLWTRSAQLMECPPGLALRAFGRLDADGVGS